MWLSVSLSMSENDFVCLRSADGSGSGGSLTASLSWNLRFRFTAALGCATEPLTTPDEKVGVWHGCVNMCVCLCVCVCVCMCKREGGGEVQQRIHRYTCNVHM